MKEHKNKVVAAFLLLACFVFQPLAAQETAGINTNRHSLWKIEGKNTVVYLLGSIHLLKPDSFPLPAALENAYSNAQIAVFETDVDKLQDPALQMKMITKSQLPAGETLKQHLSPETYAAFTNQAKDSGLPLEVFETLKPSMAAMTLSLVEVAKLGADPQNGLDKYFSDKAHKDGKQVIGLETPEFQLDLLTSFTPEEDELMMQTTLKENAKIPREFGEIVTAWQTGDSPVIEKLLNETLETTPALYKRLVADRSKSWVPKIQELLGGDKNAIVIVGVAHLVGPQGVVELLRRKGLKVTQL
jgi:uncharacterized protein YbaP (TraB family)